MLTSILALPGQCCWNCRQVHDSSSVIPRNQGGRRRRSVKRGVRMPGRFMALSGGASHGCWRGRMENRQLSP